MDPISVAAASVGKLPGQSPERMVDVRQTAEDAVRNGLATRVLVDLTAGVSADTTVAALEEMRTASVELVCSS